VGFQQSFQQHKKGVVTIVMLKNGTKYLKSTSYDL